MRFLGFLFVAVVGFSQEMETTLFVQNPAPGGTPAVYLVWIPEPLQKYCLGKTAQECASIDYCIRTTNKNVAMCKNLGMDVNRVPPYPRDMRPRRLLSVTCIRPFTLPGFDRLFQFFDSAPKESLDRLSLSVRIKARIRFTRSNEDDGFQVLEVLTVPPF